MVISKNKFGFSSAILSLFALALTTYTYMSMTTNDSVYQTPVTFISLINKIHLNIPAPSSPTMKSKYFTLFDDNKRLLFYSFSIILIVISTILSVKAYMKEQTSLYYSISALAIFNTLVILAVPVFRLVLNI